MSSDSTVETTTPGVALVARVKDQWAVVHAQWIALPETLRTAWEQVRTLLQNALELPSKDELAKLGARLDELDAKLVALAAAREAVPAAGEISAPKTTAEKRTRKR